uniref:Wsv013 n=1 Tax=White spot syndrome virus TaxID=92652 RepID=A0A2U9G930_WSSV|nr:wsv013 [Shrimp white spot syndrome virus]AWQ60623.1 wsv013 [Shrimp white spot syndrome virus]AWQ61470.1 wsv013 [Shrimp white spot syndrome virus]
MECFFSSSSSSSSSSPLSVLSPQGPHFLKETLKICSTNLKCISDAMTVPADTADVFPPLKLSNRLGWWGRGASLSLFNR